MLKKELATALGISGAMVSKLAKRGMPTDSLERAQRWRKRHLEPGRVKGQRMGTTSPPESKAPSGATSFNEVNMANHLMDAAASILEVGGDIAALLPALRTALRAVAGPMRDDVGLHLGTMEILIGPDILNEARAFQPGEAMDGDPDDATPLEPVTAEEWHEMGKFLYSVAAGEIQILPKHPDSEPDLAIPDVDELELPEGWDNLPEL